MREDQLQQDPKPESKANESDQGGASSLAKQPAILRPDEIEKLASEWQKNLASSAQLAQQVQSAKVSAHRVYHHKQVA
jgi:hypothetical protein